MTLNIDTFLVRALAIVVIALVLGFVVVYYYNNIVHVQPSAATYYIAERYTIVYKNCYGARSGDKFSTACVAKYFLVRRIYDTTMYTEVNSLNWYGLTDSMYYTHRVGDTIRINYIEKYKFSHLKYHIIEE